MVKLFIEYAQETNTKLKINKENKNKYNLLMFATEKNNTEIVRLLIDYAIKNKYRIGNK